MELVDGGAHVADVDAFLDRLGRIGDEHGVTVQAFDARYVVDRTHLRRAVDLADRAFDRDENVARDRAVEILCYAAGRRQIERALEMGVSAGTCPTVVLVDAEDNTAPDGGPDAGDGIAAERAAAEAVRSLSELEPGTALGEYDPERVRAFFDISEAELTAADGDLASLVHERVALLVVEK